jgi:hypothetical protein
MKRAAFGLSGVVSVLFGILCAVNALNLLDSIVGGGADKTTWAVFLVYLVLFLGSVYACAICFRRISAKKT